VDGPGIRVVAWTAGCQWRCRYCHNPDTWTMRNGIPVTIARATDELRKYRHGLSVMSGGFTLSGGEPLMQDRFAAKLLGAAHAMGIHTALDTNGYYGSRLSDAELEAIDLVLLDLKGWDPERHKALTGMDNVPTLEFGGTAAREGLGPARPRARWSDDGYDERRGGFAASLGNVERGRCVTSSGASRAELAWSNMGDAEPRHRRVAAFRAGCAYRWSPGCPSPSR
jgi:pyruvate formate lyase activating enzyme